MSLRQKTLLLILGLFLFLCLIFIGSSQLIISQSFKQMERDFSHRDLSRLADVLKNDEFALRKQVSEWATWDDSYEFLADADSSFIKIYLQRQTYLDLKLDVIAYIDTSGRIVFGAFNENPDSGLTPLGYEFRVQVDDKSFVFRRALEDTLTSGIILLSGRPLLLAAHAIVKRNQAGPARGVLVFGRYWDREEIAQISEITHIVVNAYSLSGSPLPDDVYQARTHLSNFCPWYFRNLDRETGAGYIQVADLYGAPALILRITMPRDIIQKSVSATRMFFFITLGLTLIFAVATVLLLEKHLISRMANLISIVTGITVARDLSVRVPVQGKDELARLSNKINEMLAAIATSNAEQKAASNELQEFYKQIKVKEEMLRGIFDSSPDGIAIMDLDGTIIQCNQALLNMHRLTDKSQMIGHRILEFVTPNERQKVIEAMKEMIRQGSLGNIETLFIGKGGALFAVEISISIVRGVDGRPSCVVSMARDRDQRKRIEQALSLSEQRYRLLFERNPAGVFRTTLDGQILDMNEAGLEIFGCRTKEELLSHKMPDYYCDPREQERFASELWDKGSISNFRREILRGDGQPAWVLENVRLVVGYKEEPLLIQGTIIDITEMICKSPELTVDF